MNCWNEAIGKLFDGLLPVSCEQYDDDPEQILNHFDMKIEHSGESMDNILKVWYIKQHYPDISLFIQTSPGFCCAGLITEAMAERIEKVTGVPVVSLTYDGAGGNPNEILVPYLRFPRAGEPGDRGGRTFRPGDTGPRGKTELILR